MTGNILKQRRRDMDLSINLSLYIITLLSVLSCMIKAEQCIKKSSCSCQLASSDFVLDLKPLSSPSNPSLIAKDNQGVYQYVYNPCDALKPPHCKDIEDVAVCQETLTAALPLSYCAGKESEVSFNGDLELNTLNIDYSCNDGQTQRTTHINVICNKDITGSLDFVSSKVSTAEYFLQLRTKYACKDLSTSNLSTGSVLLLIFFILLIVYLIAGVLFMKFVRGASGVEMVPNLEFWKGLPSLIKDGFVFVSKGCKADTTYSQI